MTATLAHICRHPIKAIGYEELERASLEKGRALPFDRHWAVTHEAAKCGPEPTEWAAKLNFLRGVAGAELMAVRAQLSHEELTLTHPRLGAISVAVNSMPPNGGSVSTTEAGPCPVAHAMAPQADITALIDWLRPLWPQGRPAPARLVHVPGQAMTDWPDPFIAILGSSSNRALGQRLGRDLSIHRWRGNLWVDGWAPFEEFDMIGRRLRIGGAVLEVQQRITRCGATRVNPETGREDADTLGALSTAYGHEDFGVYATVVQSGDIAAGDRVEVI